MADLQHKPETETCVCIFCKNSGDCGKCDGRGVREALVGKKRIKQMVECRACEGTGRCPLCQGEGQLKVG
jgi:hypothetical protein